MLLGLRSLFEPTGTSAAIAGSATLTFTNTASATGVASILGATTLAFTNTASVIGTASLVGATTVTFTNTAALGASASVLGTTALTFASTAALVGVASVQGATVFTFALSGNIALSGTAGISGSTTVTFASSGSVTTDEVVAAPGSAVGGGSSSYDQKHWRKVKEEEERLEVDIRKIYRRLIGANDPVVVEKVEAIVKTVVKPQKFAPAKKNVELERRIAQLTIDKVSIETEIALRLAAQELDAKKAREAKQKQRIENMRRIQIILQMAA